MVKLKCSRTAVISFSVFYRGRTGNAGVLINHGRGFHPDWVDTVQPLRVGLVDYGWNTLSIQMPVLAKYERNRLSTTDARTLSFELAWHACFRYLWE